MNNSDICEILWKIAFTDELVADIVKTNSYIFDTSASSSFLSLKIELVKKTWIFMFLYCGAFDVNVLQAIGLIVKISFRVYKRIIGY